MIIYLNWSDIYVDESSDFEPEKSESDDEETINKEEEDLDESERNEEIKLLQQESEMSLEDFLETLPPEILNSSSAGTDTKQKDFCDGSTSDLTQVCIIIMLYDLISGNIKKIEALITLDLGLCFQSDRIHVLDLFNVILSFLFIKCIIFASNFCCKLFPIWHNY